MLINTKMLRGPQFVIWKQQVRKCEYKLP